MRRSVGLLTKYALRPAVIFALFRVFRGPLFETLVLSREKHERARKWFFRCLSFHLPLLFFALFGVFRGHLHFPCAWGLSNAARRGGSGDDSDDLPFFASNDVAIFVDRNWRHGFERDAQMVACAAVFAGPGECAFGCEVGEIACGRGG